METDIILEGFQKAEETHGLRYMRFIGDGDSSVYPSLLNGVTGWGRDIKKIECANHSCKCYHLSLQRQRRAYHKNAQASYKYAIKMRSRVIKQKQWSFLKKTWSMGHFTVLVITASAAQTFVKLHETPWHLTWQHHQPPPRRLTWQHHQPQVITQNLTRMTR